MMQWLEPLMHALEALATSNSVMGIALVLFLEELGVPIPVPGDVMMVLAGVRVAQGNVSLVSMLLVQQTATVAGASILYWTSRSYGRPLVLRYGRYIGIGAERLAAAEERIRGREMAAVFVGRLFPGLRVISVVAAGVMGVRPAKFYPGMVAGSFVYLSFYTLLGMYAGAPVLALLARVSFPMSTLWSLAGLVTMAFVIRLLRDLRPKRPETPAWQYALGGLLAGMAGVLVANIAVGTFQFVVRMSGGSANLGLSGRLGELHLILGWPVFLLMCALLAAGYRWLRINRLPMVGRVLVTAGVPAALTLLLTVDPLRDMAGTGSRVTSAAIVTIAAASRWLTFGLVLEALPLHREHVPREAEKPAVVRETA